jgi:hypothetical protein
LRGECLASSVAPFAHLAPPSTTLILRKRLVNVAPSPALAGLSRGDDGVLRGLKMLGRVLVLRIVAAAYVAALLANAQVHPGVAHGHALGAHVLGVVLEVVQVKRLKVLAECFHK